MRQPGKIALLGLLLMVLILTVIYLFNSTIDAENLPLILKENIEAINLIIMTLAGSSVLLMVLGVFGLFFKYIVIPQLLSMSPNKVEKATRGVLPIYKYFGSSEQYSKISSLLNTLKIERK